MPLTAKGEEILKNMKEQYGEKKGEEVLYASKNKGTITGIDKDDVVTNDVEQRTQFGVGVPEGLSLEEINRRNRVLWDQNYDEELNRPERQ